MTQPETETAVPPEVTEERVEAMWSPGLGVITVRNTASEDSVDFSEDAETGTAPPEVSDERIYDDLKAYQEGGMIDYVLPTEPLGEEWYVGWRGQLLKFVTKDSIVGFLTGIQVAALFVADLRGPVDLRSWLREPPEAGAQPVASVGTQWAVAYGGDDPNDCAGILEYDDEAEAAEHVQWTNGGFLASRTVIATRWVRSDA